MASFYVHAYEEEVEEEERCCRCDRRLKSAYSVSYDGVVAKYRICPGCRAWLESAFGVKQASGGTGKPGG